MVSQKHSSVHGVPKTLQCTWCPRNTPVYMVSQKHSSVHCVPETFQCTWCPRNTPVYIVSQKHDSFHNARYKFATYRKTKQLWNRKTLFKQSYFLFTLLGFYSSISIFNYGSICHHFHQFREIGLFQLHNCCNSSSLDYLKSNHSHTVIVLFHSLLGLTIIKLNFIPFIVIYQLLWTKKTLNLEKTTSNVLFILFLIYGLHL